MSLEIRSVINHTHLKSPPRS